MYISAVMKSFLKQLPSYICLLLLLLSAQLFFAAVVAADARQDAESALLSLQRNDAVEKFPEEMKGLDHVFDVARGCFLSNDQEKADENYHLALLKSRIIESMIKASDSAPVPEVTGDQAERSPVLFSEPVEEPVAEPAHVPDAEPVSNRLVGSKGVYTVVKADTVRLVAAKLGVTQQQLRGMNSLDAKSYLKIGQRLVYNNRKIIPRRIRDGIIINIPDLTLYYFQQGTLVLSLPVALGSVVKNEKYIWQTPVGKFRITAKLKDPTWTVPQSIQTEREEQGKEVITTILPGPENPLGKYAIKTSIPGILIHSTIRPSSIYSFSSHGCIRLSPIEMERFFPQIKVNTRGEIVYQPVKLAVDRNGRVYLEVHRDVYHKSSGLGEEARQMIKSQKLSEKVDWDKFKSVVHQKSGVAEDISL